MEEFERAYNQYKLILGELASEPLLHTLSELDLDINKLKSGFSPRIPLESVRGLNYHKMMLFTTDQDRILDALIFFRHKDPYGYYRLYEVVNVEMES